MAAFVENVNRLVWGVPALVLILGVGLYISIRTRFVQVRLFPQALRDFFARLRGGKAADGAVSPFQALCTALAATVGTGNIAGVAGAIAIGGPGAIFWMWVCAILGMATKFAEATLALRYRVRENGEYAGGPMYMIANGLGKKWMPLAVIYSFFGVFAAFGVGNATQINAVVTGVNETLLLFDISPTTGGNIAMGVILAVIILLMLLGGAKRIGQVAEKLVPFASVAYLLLGFGVLIARYTAIGDAFAAIFRGAFAPDAVTGGMVGSFIVSLRTGVARGVFTNEAGMGTASIAHASASVDHPAQQGLMGIMEVFLDTVVICTMTALVILVSGVGISYGEDPGVTLTTQAFASVYGPWSTGFLTACLCLFAFATVLGWGLYGARCAQFLFGAKSVKKFAFLQAIIVVVGAVLNTKTVWAISETVNGLMAIPNLIALALLTPELVRLIREYNGGTYENFNQCQPLRAVPHAQVPSSGGAGGEKWQKNLSLKHRSAGYSNTQRVL